MNPNPPKLPVAFPESLSAGALARPHVGRGRHPESELDWHAYMAAVIRYKWLALGITLAGTAVGLVGALFVKPTYQAESAVWIETARRSQGDPSPIWAAQIMGNSGWVELVRSDLVLGYVVGTQRLFLRPNSPADGAALASFAAVDSELRPGKYRLVTDQQQGTYALRDEHDVVVDQAPVGAPIGAPLGFRWTPPGTPTRSVDFEILSGYDATRELVSNLHVRTDRDGGFMRLAVRGEDPRRVTDVTNAILQRFVSVAADLKRERLTALVGILGGQLDGARRALDEREASLKAFRTRSATVLTEGGGPTVAGLSMSRDPLFAAHLEMRVNQAQLHADRAAIERALVPGPDGTSPLQTLELVGSVQRATGLTQALHDLTTKQAELRTLQARYTDAHPLVRRLAEEVGELEGRTIPGLARELVTELQTRETLLAGQVETAGTDLRRISPLPVEEARLQRDVTIAEGLLTGLQQRYDEARLSEVSTIPDVRIIDVARVPRKPLSHLAPLIVLLGMMGGAGAAVGTAVVRQMLDRKVRIPEQVAIDMGVRILGVVPHVVRHGTDEDVGPAVEALRVIRLNMLHAYGTAGPVVFTITSAGGSEGKSFIASNLALSFSGAGQRTLLIDADTRRGALHRVMGAQRKPGLIEHLAGQLPIEQLVQRTRYPGLDFIGCGARTRTGPDLLTSPAPPRLLALLRPQYDVIIVDSPPLAAGVDPFALATLTGNVLLVVRTGVTDKKLAEAKLEVLQQLPVRMLGAVLNDARMGGAYQYLAYYMMGYELMDESEDTSTNATRMLRRGD
jgi:capsular exopolysaccharide synthesis family protein